jgi:hypothetical protein
MAGMMADGSACKRAPPTEAALRHVLAVQCGKLSQAKRGRRGRKIWHDHSASDMGWCWMACGRLQFEQISGTIGHRSNWVAVACKGAEVLGDSVVIGVDGDVAGDGRASCQRKRWLCGASCGVVEQWASAGEGHKVAGLSLDDGMLG